MWLVWHQLCYKVPIFFDAYEYRVDKNASSPRLPWLRHKSVLFGNIAGAIHNSIVLTRRPQKFFQKGEMGLWKLNNADADGARPARLQTKANAAMLHTYKRRPSGAVSGNPESMGGKLVDGYAYVALACWCTSVQAFLWFCKKWKMSYIWKYSIFEYETEW